MIKNLFWCQKKISAFYENDFSRKVCQKALREYPSIALTLLYIHVSHKTRGSPAWQPHKFLFVLEKIQVAIFQLKKRAHQAAIIRYPASSLEKKFAIRFIAQFSKKTTIFLL